MNYIFYGFPHRNQRYLDWVKTLPSAISGKKGCDAHHTIGHGHGAVSSKVSDYWAFPLTREEHNLLHQKGWKWWEKRYGPQWKYVCQTVARAIDDGVLKI